MLYLFYNFNKFRKGTILMNDILRKIRMKKKKHTVEIETLIMTIQRKEEEIIILQRIPVKIIFLWKMNVLILIKDIQIIQ